MVQTGVIIRQIALRVITQNNVYKGNEVPEPMRGSKAGRFGSAPLFFLLDVEASIFLTLAHIPDSLLFTPYSLFLSPLIKVLETSPGQNARHRVVTSFEPEINGFDIVDLR